MALTESFGSPNSRPKFEQTLAGDNKMSDSFSLEDDNDRKPASIHPFQLVSPRTITGPANMINKGAIDWGYHGLMAYGSNSTVFIVDTRNVQLVQTLDRHKSTIKKILWVSGVETKRDGNPGIQLISGDASGQIIHWDISTSTALAILQDGNKPVLGMEWVPGMENELMLAALHSPYFLIIWDIKKQSKLWKKSFTDTLFSFNFDPFDGSKIAFLCHDCILFVDDFKIGKIPSTNGRKYYISSPRLDASYEETIRGRDRLKKLMKGLVVAETKPKPDEVMTISECLQLMYHKSLRHHLILLYPRDIILIDLHIYQTVGIVPIERTMSPLLQVISTRHRDVLYCLHESGSVSVKVRRKALQTITPSPLDGNDNSTSDFGTYSSEMFISYEHKYQSEVIRQIKGSKVLGIALDPISEKNIGLFLSSGKVVFLELELNSGNENSHLRTISDLFSPLSVEKAPLRLLPVSLLSGINGNITVMKMCPPMTKRNRDFYLPLLAVGTNTGYLYLYHLSYGTIYKEFAIHGHPIRGLEWTGLRSIITFGYGDGNKVKNEVNITDIRTGQTMSIRTDKNAENPISILRVSPLRQYFVIYLKEGPFELWDLATLTLLRAITKKFPSLTAVEWSPIYSVKSLQSKRKSKSDIYEAGCRALVREHLVLSDNNSQLYHFSVEGDSIKDGMKIPPESGVNMVTSLAFKANQIVLSDMDGCVNLWDLKARSSKNVNTNRGPIRYLRFAPGKTNLKFLILFNDGIDIIDLDQNQYEKIAQLKWGRENSKIIDADWANSELPVIGTEDGWIRILDINLLRSSSPISQYNFKYVIKCPSMLSPKLLTKMQFILCTQFWKLTPNFRAFSVQDGIPEQNLAQVNSQLELLNIPPEFGELNVAEKCLRVSEMFGDSYGVDLWTVALYYLKVAAADKKSKKDSSVPQSDSGSMDLKRINHYPDIEPLDTCYDYLMDPYSYQHLQLDRVNLHEWKRGDYRHTQMVVERLVLLGEMDRAVQLLLETDIDNVNYYTDAIKDRLHWLSCEYNPGHGLKMIPSHRKRLPEVLMKQPVTTDLSKRACLVATIQQTGAAQSTIKLVATNLIANGKIWEGVQLLCLIGKGLDGCRYLVSYGMWESAVWLAKSILPIHDAVEVMKKFADHLSSNGDRFAAILVLISQLQFEKALEMLYSQHQVITGAMLLMACQHYGIDISQQLIVAIYSSLHDYLLSIGNLDGARGLADHLKIKVS